MTATWQPLEPDFAAIFARCADPCLALARGEVPAVILRGALPPADCAAILQQLDERRLFQPPRTPGSFQYVGTSLGMLGDDPARFFSHARETLALFGTLFAGRADPVRRVYEWLQRLAGEKRVVTAHEPDGRRYGPAIFRRYPPGAGHAPHFDSVRLREKRIGYAVYEFPHQFAGVLCLEEAEPDPENGEAILYQQQWEPRIQPLLEAGEFHRFAAERRLPRVRINLATGDFYVFNTRHIHEVPPIRGARPRTVLATFLGYDPERPEIFVWS